MMISVFVNITLRVKSTCNTWVYYRIIVPMFPIATRRIMMVITLVITVILMMTMMESMMMW